MGYWIAKQSDYTMLPYSVSPAGFKELLAVLLISGGVNVLDPELKQNTTKKTKVDKTTSRGMLKSSGGNQKAVDWWSSGD